MKWDTYHTKKIKSKYLYRYIKLDKLISFLKTGSLYFTRMDSFKDGLEGIIPYDITELWANLQPLPKKEQRNKKLPEEIWIEAEEKRLAVLKDIQQRLKKKQSHLYVSCWYLGDSESLGMWELYGLNGFVIRFERKYIQDLVNSKRNNQKIIFDKDDLLVGGLIRYQNFDDIPWKEEDSLIKYSGFRKHVAFRHEEEYRFIIHKMDSQIEGITYYLETINELQFKIFANPSMGLEEFKKNEQTISEYTRHKLNESNLKNWIEFKNMKSE